MWTETLKDQWTRYIDWLLKYYLIFLKLVKNLDHTSKIVPDLKFMNVYSIKTPPFPICQTLQKAALPQINQLLEARIIELNYYECCSDQCC